MAAAWSKDTSAAELPYAIYSASKTEGERALWKFVKEVKPPFAINTVLPAANVSLATRFGGLAGLLQCSSHLLLVDTRVY